MTPEDRVRKNAFPPWKHFLTWTIVSQHSCHVCALIHTGLWAWRLEAIYTAGRCWLFLRPGGVGGVWPMKNPHRLLFVKGLFGRRRASGGKINSRSRAAVAAPLILFVVPQDPWSWSSIVFVLCIIQMKPGIFRLSLVCFLLKDCWEEYRVLAYMKQTTNFGTAITFLNYLGFSSPLSVCNCPVLYPRMCS